VAATNRPSDLRKRATAAVATLLGVVSTGHTAKDKPTEPAPAADRWLFDTSFMQYGESERISVSEPQVGVRREFSDGRALSILATVDTVSGSTPLGTAPLTQNTATNTVTGPSGRLVSPDVGRVPVSNMSDTRIALSGSYERPLSQVSRNVFGLNAATEHDFLSLGGNGTYHHDFNQKNTTLSLGLAPEFDFVSPNGGLPYAYGTQHSANEFERKTKTKYLVSGLVGLTQVINRKTLMQLNYSPTYENGYLNDPYKLLSLVNAGGDPLSAIHEKRPGSRLGHSLFWLTRYNLRADDVFGLSLRFYGDDWGVGSQTIDFNYRWQVHPRGFLQPHVRYYHQTSADFFRSMLPNGQPLPDHASSDYRLTDIDGVTFGMSVGWTFRNESELILRAEYYTQTGESKPKDAIGVQQDFDLFPTLHASIIQVDYHFEPRRLFSRKNGR
jgi:hypothetical protein